jgi:hypothetical protein
MDSLITAAARALAAGDPLGALKRVALRDDPPALALRGIAMAQLGESRERRNCCGVLRWPSVRKKPLHEEGVSWLRPRSRWASRDLSFSAKTLDAARVTLGQHDDRECRACALS